jgi:hypothetical protein
MTGGVFAAQPTAAKILPVRRKALCLKGLKRFSLVIGYSIQGTKGELSWRNF